MAKSSKNNTRIFLKTIKFYPNRLVFGKSCPLIKFYWCWGYCASYRFPIRNLMQTWKKSKTVREPNFPEFNCQNCFGNKLLIYKKVDEERDQNVFICSKSFLILKLLPSIWSIYLRNVWLDLDLLLFRQNVHIFHIMFVNLGSCGSKVFSCLCKNFILKLW